jgi:peptide/nickel transport system substrate-binding protein
VIRALALVIALIVALVLPGAPSRASSPHVITYADSLDISSLNMFLATTANITALSELTMGFFTRFDAKGNPIPELVTEIPTIANGGVSRDGLTVTWHLRHGVRWSDGLPFDASDVVYTYRVAIDPGNNIGVRDPWMRLRSVDAAGPYTVVFHFKQPYALFVQDYFSSQSTSCILPKHALGPGTAINDAPYNAKPIGMGPFRYTAFERGDRVEMEANPYYWRGTPKLHGVTYKIITDVNTLLTQLQTGELDIGDTLEGTVAVRAKTIPGKKTSTRPSTFIAALYFNVTRGAVADVKVREALSLATNRQLVLDKVALGIGVLTESLVPKTTVDYADLPVRRYDPGRAAALLDADGWKRSADGMRSKNGAPLAIDLAIPAGYAPSASLANVVHDDWGRLGVAVTIHTWADAQFFAPVSAGGIIQSGKFDVANYSIGVGPIYSAINGYYDCAGIPPNGFNVPRYCNRAVDALDDRYLHSFDPAERHALAARFQRIISDDFVGIVLYERNFLAAYDARITGYHPNAYSFWGDPLDLNISPN